MLKKSDAKKEASEFLAQASKSDNNPVADTNPDYLTETEQNSLSIEIPDPYSCHLIDGLPNNFSQNRTESPLSSNSFFAGYTSGALSEKVSNMHWRKSNLTLRQSEIDTQLRLVRRMAQLEFQHSDLEPSDISIARTKRAARDFFALSHELLDKYNEDFPLANKNKCLGMAVIRNNKSVFIAISQDKNAHKDILIRTQMIDFLTRINAMTNEWRFELVHTPTPMEYVLPRTLEMRTSRPPLQKEVEPRMRCVEVHLMVALNKVRRTIKYSTKDVAMLAFGATLWSRPNDSQAATHFGAIKRNTNYLTGIPIPVRLYNGNVAYIDVWSPCKEHCSIYYKHMLAIAAADEHLHGDRAEQRLPYDELVTEQSSSEEEPQHDSLNSPVPLPKGFK